MNGNAHTGALQGNRIEPEVSVAWRIPLRAQTHKCCGCLWVTLNYDIRANHRTPRPLPQPACGQSKCHCRRTSQAGLILCRCLCYWTSFHRRSWKTSCTGVTVLSKTTEIRSQKRRQNGRERGSRMRVDEGRREPGRRRASAGFRTQIPTILGLCTQLTE